LRRQNPQTRLRFDLNFRVTLLLIGAYLLHLCDSKTSMTCLLLGAGILAATRLPMLQPRLRFLGVMVCAGFLGYLALNQFFDVKGALLEDLGRNPTLTGRTDVWRVLLQAGTDPVLGTGYMSFWDDPSYQSKLPNWVAYSAHNGYLEIYLCGGAVGICFLAVMLLASGIRVNQALAWDGDYGVVRFAVFLIALLADYTETNFAWMTPVGFLFLTATIGHAETATMAPHVDEPLEAPAEVEPADIEAEVLAASFRD
jgi:O-antigen ligase